MLLMALVNLGISNNPAMLTSMLAPLDVTQSEYATTTLLFFKMKPFFNLSVNRTELRPSVFKSDGVFSDVTVGVASPTVRRPVSRPGS